MPAAAEARGDHAGDQNVEHQRGRLERLRRQAEQRHHRDEAGGAGLADAAIQQCDREQGAADQDQGGAIKCHWRVTRTTAGYGRPPPMATVCAYPDDDCLGRAHA
ncbi:hypothetical protein D3C78_1571970 [compost metagenome]